MPFANASESVISWLLSLATRKLPLAQLLPSLADRLGEHGITVDRMRTSATTKHPEIFVRSILWRRGEETFVEDFAHEVLDAPVFLQNPVKQVRKGADMIRCPLQGPTAVLSYAICQELAADKFTDYVIFGVDFSCGERTYFSFATQRSGGFVDEEIELFKRILPALTPIIELESKEYALRSLLTVYLGPNAATRVLHGAFRRGTGQSIEAAVWYCDMRDFTEFADTSPASEVVKVLDRFFEAVTTPVSSYGGEVLKFIGDAVLAIFPVGDPGRPDACARALAAAQAAHYNVQAMNKRDSGQRVELGIALHVGDVMYGNIGTKERLDFTAIGAVINEVCRVEELCRTLGPILLTSEFATHLSSSVMSRGVHSFKGIGLPKELFVPR